MSKLVAIRTLRRHVKMLQALGETSSNAALLDGSGAFEGGFEVYRSQYLRHRYGGLDRPNQGFHQVLGLCFSATVLAHEMRFTSRHPLLAELNNALYDMERLWLRWFGPRRYLRFEQQPERVQGHREEGGILLQLAQARESGHTG